MSSIQLKTESNPVTNRKPNQAREGELIQVKHGEKNQVSQKGQHGNSDANYDASVRYLMEKCLCY